MEEQQKWIEWIKSLPAWVKAAIGLLTAIVGLVILFQENYYIGTITAGILSLTFLLCLCVYLFFAKTSPLVEGGEGVYRYPAYRPWAAVGVVLVSVAVGSAFILRPSRSFIIAAFVGTLPPMPFQPAAEDEILIVIAPFDGSEDIHPEAWIERNLLEKLRAVPELTNVRVERYPKAIAESDSRTELEYMEEIYKPAIIIWGWYDSLGIVANYEVAQRSGFWLEGYEPSLAEALRLPSAPDAFVFHVTRKLPTEVTYLTFFTIAQIYAAQRNYIQAQINLEKAIASFPQDEHFKAQTLLQLQMNLALVRLLGFDDFQYGIQVMTDLIEKDSSNIEAYYYRGIFFEFMSLYEYIERNDVDYVITMERFDEGYIPIISSNKEIPLEAFQSSEAIQDYTYVIEHSRNPRPVVYYARGRQNYAFGNIEAAIHDMRIYLREETAVGYTTGTAEEYIDAWSAELLKLTPSPP
jgi:tetratricopeptide (TPR) repeat protein